MKFIVKLIILILVFIYLANVFKFMNRQEIKTVLIPYPVKVSKECGSFCVIKPNLTEVKIGDKTFKKELLEI